MTMNNLPEPLCRADGKAALNRAISIATTADDPIVALQAGAEFLQQLLERPLLPGDAPRDVHSEHHQGVETANDRPPLAEQFRKPYRNENK